MTTEREEALELAREAGFDEFQGQRDNNEIDYYFEGWPEHVEKLVRLAKQRGAEEQKRKDVEVIRGLTHKLAELEKDAARYRWLRRSQLNGDEPFIARFECGSFSRWCGDMADSAIDDAMRPSQPTTLPE